MKPYRIYEVHAGQLMKIRNIRNAGIKFDSDSLDEAKQSVENLINLHKQQFNKYIKSPISYASSQFVILYYSDLFTSKIIWVSDL